MKKLVSTVFTVTVAATMASYICMRPLAAGLAAPSAVQTPDPGITAGGVIGEVTAIDAGSGRMTVKTDAGSIVSVVLNPQTSYMRLAPGEKSLEKAAKISVADVGSGDRVWARGKVEGDRKSVPARMVVVMSKADLSAKQDREREEWRKRGLVGVIASIDPATKEIVVARGRSATAPRVVVPAAGERVEFRRYAPDSIKFSDALPSSFADLKVGDQVRALGEKNSDGSRFTPEVIVSGAFRTVGGTVTAVKPDTGEVTITDIQTKQPLTIVVKKDSSLHRIPPERAAMIAAFMSRTSPGPGGETGTPSSGGATPAGGAATRTRGGESPAGGGGGGAPGGQRFGPQGGGNFDMQSMIERMPAVSVTDLKPGDMVIVLSTVGNDPSRATAISLVAGVEPLLNAVQARQQRQPGGGARRGAGGQSDLGDLGGLDLGIGMP